MKKRSIQEVKAQHVTRLMAMQGVTSVGIGLSAEGEPLILIGVVNAESNIVSALPRELEGYAVEYHVTGKVKTQDSTE